MEKPLLNAKDLGINLMHSKHDENKKKIRISVASIYDPETGCMSFGVSKCSKKDIFVKREGRALALGRLGFLGSKPTFKVEIKPEEDLRRFFRNKFHQIEDFLQKKNLKSLIQLDNTPGAELAFEIEKPTATEAEIPQNV